jgi:PAS domain S-box-containing protein/diguanylate cyclase (GGDEF)-like protein
VIYSHLFLYMITPHLIAAIISCLLIIIFLGIVFILLNKDKRLYELMIEKSLAGIYIVQGEEFAYLNKKAANILGYEPAELQGQSIYRIFPEEERPRLINNLQKIYDRNDTMIQEEYQCIKKDGTPVFIEVTGSLLTYNGELSLMGSVNDVTYQKQVKSVLTFYDPLTSLPTLSMIHRMVNETIEKSGQNPMALLLVRLNRLTTIQRAYGHDMGEKLLGIFLERIRSVVSTRDIVTRYSDNKIIMLVFNVNKAQAIKLSKDLLELLHESIHFENYDLTESANIGIGLYPDVDSIDKLVENAHTAMRLSQEKGTNQIQVFDQELQKTLQERADIERDLDQAIAKSEFVLYYQPKVNLITGKINGMEALIRWLHPTKGLLSPGVFIPLAERTGRIIPITNWVIQMVTTQIKEWEKIGLNHVVVSINVSPLHFVQPGFVNELKQMITESSVDPCRLELEITESLAINIEEAIDKINELKTFGFQISIDDFGTGYSSLGQVNRLPVDKLKIDQSFMRRNLSESNNGSVITTIITLAHNIGCRAVAEGVETIEQLNFLQKNACNEAQGFLFSPPLPPDVILERWDEIERVVHENTEQENLVSGWLNL